MPSDPRQCRINAARCLALAKRARKPEARDVWTKMAETWERLAEIGSHQPYTEIPEIEFGGADGALPDPLKLRLGEYA
jgi:hypothetical protein